MNLNKILQTYDTNNLTIGVLGGHSALDICHGAKQLGFGTLVVAQKGREKTYTKHYLTRNGVKAGAQKAETLKADFPKKPQTSEKFDKNDLSGLQAKGCVDEVLALDKFADIAGEQVQQKLRERNTIFVHNRYFWVYCNWREIENRFEVPIYGSRGLLKLEERDIFPNQYDLLRQAGISLPKIFETYEKIDRLVIVKVNEAQRGYERAFFFASSPQNYLDESQKLLQKGVITSDALQKAVIEEYVLGTQINLNFFYSPLTGENELMGTDTRRQTDLDGFLRLTADQQLEVLKHQKPRIIESGHYAVTMKESLVEKAYDLAEKFVKATQKEFAPGIIGPYALQGALSTRDNREEFVIFDVSLRMPGSPGTRFTPYTSYLYGRPLSYGERVAMEIKQAVQTGRLREVLS